MMATEQNTKFLTEQYRMNKEIMHLSNELVYGGKMSSHHSASVRCLKNLYLPGRLTKFLKGIDENHGQSKANYLSHALGGLLRDSVVFLNTEKIETSEVRADSSLANATEAKLVVAICMALQYVSKTLALCGS